MSLNEYLEKLTDRMKLQGENVFKVRAFEKACEILSHYSDSEIKFKLKNQTLTDIAGIGKGIAQVASEFLIDGNTQTLDLIEASLPQGLTELAQVAGLGPKKARVLIEALEITSLKELEYACRENRLVGLKGFGEKLQGKILENVLFLRASAGQVRLGDIQDQALEAIADLNAWLLKKGSKASETGALRRRLEVLDRITILVQYSTLEKPSEQPRFEAEVRAWISKNFETSGKFLGLPVELHFCEASQFELALLQTSATESFLAEFEKNKTLKKPLDWAEISTIPSEAYETGESLALLRAGKFPRLVQKVRGVFHFHTTRSDGSHSLEQMVQAAIELGYDYLGVSDHSQSAFYAQGLKVPDLIDQAKEVKKLREKYPQIRLFWGIESDILADGSLDYDAAVLKDFDFVIASIHSRFQMDSEAMTERLVKAVKNKHTRFLGHPTGRLLLGRKPYAFDFNAVLDAATQSGVAIELNAHPARLDIDWRHGPELRSRNTLVSISPDAHSSEGFKDVRYGIQVAKKALLDCSQVVNTWSVKEVEKWLLS